MLYIVSLTLKSLKQETVYRTAMFAGLATNLFFGVMHVLVLLALYQQQPEINGVSRLEAITYIGMVQASIAYLRAFGSYDLMQTVYSGEVGSDFLKPVDYFLLWMGRDLGRSIFNLFGRGIIFMLIFSLFFPVQLPSTMVQWLLFGLAICTSWLVSFSFRFLVNLASFWTPEAVGIGRMLYSIGMLFAGFIMPLRLLPDWFHQLAYFTFFPSMINTPIEIFLGDINRSQAILLIGQSLAWFLVLTLAGKLVLNAGIRRLVVQGG